MSASDSTFASLRARITELEAETASLKKLHIDHCPIQSGRIEELEAALAKVKAQADYINNQADAAQVRLLKHGTGREVPLYDDTYWQGVADRVRFELYQALEPSE